MFEVFITIKDGFDLYYLLKVERRGFNVYCFIPHLGVHHSLHETGESHFRYEKAAKAGRQPPVTLMSGAGKIIGKDKICEPLGDLGRASSICTVSFFIDSLVQDFRKFNRRAEKCFVIDKELFPKDTSEVEVGVWAVPERNKISFEFNNPNIPENLLYKVTQCEPQVWIYARPFQ